MKLDEVLGFNEWKEADEDSYFDYILVRHLVFLLHFSFYL